MLQLLLITLLLLLEQQLLLFKLLIDKLELQLFKFFKLCQRLVEYPSFQELVAETLVRLGSHGILVHESLKDLFDVSLSEDSITAS